MEVQGQNSIYTQMNTWDWSHKSRTQFTNYTLNFASKDKPSEFLRLDWNINESLIPKFFEILPKMCFFMEELPRKISFPSAKVHSTSLSRREPIRCTHSRQAGISQNLSKINSTMWWIIRSPDPFIESIKIVLMYSQRRNFPLSFQIYFILLCDYYLGKFRLRIEVKNMQILCCFPSLFIIFYVTFYSKWLYFVERTTLKLSNNIWFMLFARPVMIYRAGKNVISQLITYS